MSRQPIREIQWLADQPDTIASSHELFVDFLETDHTIPGSNLAHDTLPVQTISTKLTRETGNLIPAMFDESGRAADELWDLDADSWKEVDTMPDIQHMIAQVIGQAFILKNATVADVFKNGNHKMTTDSAGRKLWEKKADFNDLGTEKWVPQGISSTADALDGGTYEGKDGWMVSWHRKDNKGVRVTFVDKFNNKYRHVLLVYPSLQGRRLHSEVAIHAGGIMWYGDKPWYSVLVGEYQPNTTVPVRMAKFALNDATGRLKVDGKTAKATWAYCVGIERMQGAVSANGKIYISRSNGKSN
ncbi:hypothetical protein C8A00DRAFT_32774 [Chaetomidium leptoderma]|uniref:Uncharacterized protein n=1 Tax=Chaetomidium leptoderma TaxID=669021 RepID=A0AAN6VQ98_9PEZI|nr:hypothetical protein C8A00DRAFT_32774 [Chaetomidium leptoderma]